MELLRKYMKKKGIIAGLIVIVLVLALVASYFLRPVSVFQVKHRLSKDSEWKENVKEIKMKNLNEKMGVQLFAVKFEYWDSYFLVNHWDDMELFESKTNKGGFFCQDIDKDGEYEVFYMIRDPYPFGMSYPMIITYGVRDGMFVMESAFHFTGIPCSEWKMTIENGKIFIRNKASIEYPSKYDTEYDMELRYEEDGWACYGEHADEITVEDRIEDYIENGQKSLKDY